MASYSVYAKLDESQTSPILVRGEIRISADVTVYYRIGENPIADSRCAVIRAGQSITTTLPSCGLKIAFLATNNSGHVSIVQVNKTKASCSAR